MDIAITAVACRFPAGEDVRACGSHPAACKPGVSILPAPRLQPQAPAAQLVVLSAKSAAALRRRQCDLLLWLRGDAGATPLADVAATLLAERQHPAYRHACVATDADELADDLELALAAKAPSAGNAATGPTPEQQARAESLLAELIATATPPAAPDRQRLQQLARLYVAGADLAWQALHAGRAVQRVHLPAYPFARQRQRLAPAANPCPHTAPGERQLHPLLHRNLSTLGAQRYASTFSGMECLLGEQRMGDHPVLPGATYLEIVRAAVLHTCAAHGAGTVEFSDVTWLRPLPYLGTPLEVQLDLAAAGSHRSALEFRVTAGTAPDTPLHCRGSARLVTALPSRIDVARLERHCTAPAMDAAACDRPFEARGPHAGSARLRHGAGECLADLGAPVGNAVGFTLHPGVVEAALQAAVALAAASGSTAAVRPFSAERIVVHAACNTAMRAWVRRSPGHAVGKFDIDVFAADAGSVAPACLEIRGLGLASSASGSHPAPGAPAVPRDLTDSLYAPAWTARPLQPGAQPVIDDLLLVGHPADVHRLATQLRCSESFAATRITCLHWGGEPAAVRPESLADHAQAVTALAGTPTHVLLVAPRRAVQADADDPDLLDTARGLFALTRALLCRARQVKLVHLVAGEQPDPAYLGLSGFYKTLHIEKPGYQGRVVHCVTDGPKAIDLPRVLHGELCADDPETEVRHTSAGRTVRCFLPVERLPRSLHDAMPDTPLRQHGVYLIAGGMGALGQIVARHLCQHYQATVYLTGRSAPNAEQLGALEALCALGGEARYIACDLADRDSVRRAVASVRQAGQRLQGVIHSAGVIEDAFIARKQPEAFARVITPKVLGTRNLDLETRDEPLDFFVLFSSFTGVLGHAGQCDHAYASASEDHYAHHRAALGAAGQRPGKTLSLNWPCWKDGGMRLTDKEEAILRGAFGIVPLQTADGLAALEYGLRQPQAQLVLMQGDRARIHQMLGVPPAAAAQADAAMPRAGAQGPDAAPCAAGQSPCIVCRWTETFAAPPRVPASLELDRPPREPHRASIRW